MPDAPARLARAAVSGSEHAIGHGGFATVYLADDLRLRRRVAVKLLHAGLTQPLQTYGGGDFVALLMTEARLAAELEHPHILPVYDYGEIDGVGYVVMAYAPGGTLEELLRGSGPLTLERAGEFLRQAAA